MGTHTVKITDRLCEPQLTRLQAPTPGTPCLPFSTEFTDTLTLPIPASCLPVPAGATPECPTDITFTCATGTPTVIGPGLVSVPATSIVSPFTQIIRAANGAVICTIAESVPPSTTSFNVSCPVTLGVECTCEFGPFTCQCTFDATRTQIICNFTHTLTLTCASLPQPTEIVCIDVDKVYDFCFEQDTGLMNCVAIPPSCGAIPTGSTANCTVTNVHCITGTPVATGVDGLATVPVTVTVIYDVNIASPTGLIICTIPRNTFVFAKTVVMCAPAGTTADCEAFVACGPCTIVATTPPPSGQVCCAFNICLIVETSARVKLLVPSTGFCTPAPCRTGGFPPFACPPSTLFPPQCTPLAG